MPGDRQQAARTSLALRSIHRESTARPARLFGACCRLPGNRQQSRKGFSGLGEAALPLSLSLHPSLSLSHPPTHSLSLPPSLSLSPPLLPPLFISLSLSLSWNANRPTTRNLQTRRSGFNRLPKCLCPRGIRGPPQGPRDLKQTKARRGLGAKFLLLEVFEAEFCVL